MALLSYDASDRVLRLTFQFHPDLVALAKTIYGYRWRKSKKAWEYPPTLETARKIVDTFDPDCGPGFAEWHARETRLRKAAERAQGILSGKVDVVGDFGFVFHTEPYEHQRRYCEWAAARDLAGLTHRAQFSEQGTGKTKAEIDMTTWEVMKGICEGAPVIMCPNSVKRSWAAEFNVHAPSGLFAPVIVDGSCDEKLEILDSLKRYADAGVIPVIIVNYDVLSQPSQRPVLQRLIALRDDKMFGKIVLDESVAIKNVKSQRGSNAYTFARNIPVRVVMTGTPYGNCLTDIFGQVRVMDIGILGPSWPSFRRYHEIRGGWQGKEIIGYQHEAELRDKVNRHAFRVLLKDCTDMPEEIDVRRTCDLSPEQVRITDELRKRMLAEMETEDGSSWVLTADQAMTQLLRFNQIASGFLEDGTRVTRFNPNPKLELLLGIICDEISEDEKAVVWCAYKADVRAISDALKKAKIDHALFYGDVDMKTRAQEEYRFKNVPECRVMIATPDTGGLGLNWQAACNCIFYSYGFRWDLLNQARARIRRLTQRNRMRYFWLVAENPVTRKASHGVSTGVNQYILDNLDKTGSMASFMTGDVKTRMRQALEVM